MTTVGSTPHLFEGSVPVQRQQRDGRSTNDHPLSIFVKKATLDKSSRGTATLANRTESQQRGKVADMRKD